VRVLVTGATGFVGQHVVPALLKRGHDVIAIGRSTSRAALFSWYRQVLFVEHDLSASTALSIPDLGRIHAVMHLAWPGLPNYNALFHIEENVPAAYSFLKSCVFSGISQMLVTGTCLEYGLREGCLTESMPAAPVNTYAIAKDTLRRYLQVLHRETPFVLQWVRLFYMHGPGQNPNSVLAKLEKAVHADEPVFPMSAGEQLRDYLPVQEVARRLALLVEHPELDGLVNCCSGQAISIRRLVEQRLTELGASISLDLGRHPYPEYEPLAFWGSVTKLSAVLDLESRNS